MRTAVISLALFACSSEPTQPTDAGIDLDTAQPPVDQTSPPVDTGMDVATDEASPPPAPIVIAAAGDISGTSISNQQKTSDLIYGKGFDAVLVLGDTQYPSGTLNDFNFYFDPTWGRFKSLIYPAVGNHEYGTPNAAGYVSYFGSRAGDPAKLYYSYDLGDWHFIALNTNDLTCTYVPCDATSAQVAWLKADLAANTKKCTLAYWHHPRFNSGTAHTDFQAAAGFWDALYAAGVEIVLNGHEHIYERFDPMTPAQVADPVKGIRQFIVGTGGIGFSGIGSIEANSLVREASSYGVLKLTLKADSYDWEFLAVAPSTFTDTGTGTCH